MIKNLIPYNIDDENQKIMLFLPGYSGGLSTEILDGLIGVFSEEGGSDVFGLNIDYLDDTLDVFQKSQDSIKESIEWLKSSYPEKEIVVIGKSLGGALALHAIESLPIKTLIILGCPVVLGWPQRISLLTASGAVTPDYKREWSTVFEATTKPIHIINGNSDDLVDNVFIQLMATKNPCIHLTVLDGVDHGMKHVVTQKLAIQECISGIKNASNK